MKKAENDLERHRVRYQEICNRKLNEAFKKKQYKEKLKERLEKIKIKIRRKSDEHLHKHLTNYDRLKLIKTRTYSIIY